MKINMKTVSMNEVFIFGLRITFSYGTPVEISIFEGQDYMITITTKEKFSRTTSKQMNKYCYEPNCEPKDFKKVVDLIDSGKFLKAKNLIKKLLEAN